MGQDPATSPVVVVAIDEESLRTPPFKDAPMQTWTGEIGRVLSATLVPLFSRHAEDDDHEATEVVVSVGARGELLSAVSVA